MKNLISMTKKFISPTKSEIIYLIVVILGLSMICGSAFIIVVPDSICSKLLSIMGAIGTGAFPTGIIGIVLEKMQKRSIEQEKCNKRLAILRLFNNAAHGYLNIICNAIIKAEPTQKGNKIFSITSTLKYNKFRIENSEDEQKALTLLIRNLKDSFGTVNPLYITTDIFDTIEIDGFEKLLHDGESLLCLLKKGKEVSEVRIRFISYLQVTCSAISECSSFNKMISDGDNIYIPNI